MRRSAVNEGLPIKHIHIMHMSPDSEENLTEIFERLTEYEDTGLTPEEIMDGKMLTGWIPVSERLPEDPQSGSDIQEYLVTIDGADQSTTLSYIGDGQWRDDDGNWYKVLAWMPKPEVYRPEQNCGRTKYC